jgi:hypothetical protein
MDDDGGMDESVSVNSEDEQPLTEKRKHDKLSFDDDYEPVVLENEIHRDVDEYDWREEDFDNEPAYMIDYDGLRAYNARVRNLKAKDTQFNLLAIAAQSSKRLKLAEAAANNSKTLTPREKSNLAIIEGKNDGKPSELYLDKDVDNLLHIPLKTTEDEEAALILGEMPEIGTNLFCFACSRGGGFAVLETTMLSRFNGFFSRALERTNFINASLLISHYYLHKIQKPVNRTLNGQRPLPNWHPVQVYICLKRHRLADPSIWKKSELEGLASHKDMIKSQIYVIDAAIAKSGKAPEKRHVHVKQANHKMYMETLAMELQIHKFNPVTSKNFNEKLGTLGKGEFIGTKDNIYAQTTITRFLGRREDPSKI